MDQGLPELPGRFGESKDLSMVKLGTVDSVETTIKKVGALAQNMTQPATKKGSRLSMGLSAIQEGSEHENKRSDHINFKKQRQQKSVVETVPGLDSTITSATPSK